MKRARRLEQLATAIGRCQLCTLGRSRSRAVPGAGDPAARLLFVGEAPGRCEDQSGQPFMGPAGKFLDRLLRKHHIRREDVFLTSCVKCRPPGNRNPKAGELTTCVHTWLLPQIALVDPEIVVLCGRVAVQALLEKSAALEDLHGTEQWRNGRRYFVTYHPAAGMRFPKIAKAMHLDFDLLTGQVNSTFPPKSPQVTDDHKNSPPQ